MAFEVGKREKIFVGVVGLVFTIAALHFMLFAPRHNDLAAAKLAFAEAQANAGKGRVSADWESQVAQYEAETLKLKQEYDKRALEMRMVHKEGEEIRKWPKVFEEAVWGYMTNPTHPYPGEDAIAQELIKRVKAIQTFAQQHPQFKMTFLDAGWRIPKALPEAYTRGQINLQDEINKLNGYNRLLNSKVTDANSLNVANAKKWAILESLTGTSAADTYYTIPNDVGTSVITLKNLMHIDLIMQYLKSAGTSAISESLLRSAFDVKLHPVESMNLALQLDALLVLLQSSQESGIEEITRVKLDTRKIKVFDEQWLKAPAPPGSETPTPTPTPAPAGGYGGYGAYGGYGGYGGGATATPAITQETVGDVMPIEIQMIGTNQNIINCLYNIANHAAYLPIDALTLRGSVPLTQGQIQGKVVADAVVNVQTDVPESMK